MSTLKIKLLYYKFKYSIKSFQKFFLVIFDMGYDDLITNKNSIIRYNAKRINFGKNIFYNLKGIFVFLLKIILHILFMIITLV